MERLWSEQASRRCHLQAQCLIEQLLATVRAGDTDRGWRPDRLGRSLGHLVATVNQLVDSGVQLRSLHEQIDTTTANGRAHARHMYRPRPVRKGARDRAYAGRPGGCQNLREETSVDQPKITADRTRWARELATAGRSVADIAPALDVSRATVYRMLADEITAN